MRREKSAFMVNGKALVAEYEARTTLWEVIADQVWPHRNEPELQ